MVSIRRSILISLGLAGLFIAGGADAQSPEADGPEILSRGPVHEAFAQPTVDDPSEAYVVPKTPPPAIEEIPPETKPEGDNVQWIHGYWSWDEERSDFLWVSGVWRQVPPGMHWVAGAFIATPAGWRWSSGYWTPDLAAEPEVVPEAPPASLEQGANSPPTSDDSLWVEGTWLWRGSWAWRPGYWTVADADWVWSGPHYVWTPRGYVFIDGYWDYAPERRGWLFAPVYYGPHWRFAAGYRWRPSVVIGVDLMFDFFFCQPRHRHYYFGDYYDARWTAWGYYPWFESRHRHHRDHLYAYAAWHHRREPNWDARNRSAYQERREHPEERPPSTLRLQNEWVARPNPRVERTPLARPIAEARRLAPVRRVPPARPTLAEPQLRPRAMERDLSPNQARSPEPSLNRAEPGPRPAPRIDRRAAEPKVPPRPSTPPVPPPAVRKAPPPARVQPPPARAQPPPPRAQPPPPRAQPAPPRLQPSRPAPPKIEAPKKDDREEQRRQKKRDDSKKLAPKGSTRR